MYLWSVKVSTSLLLLLPPEEQVQPHGAGCSWKLRDYLLWSSRPRPEAGEDQKLKTSGKELPLHQDAWRERHSHLYQTALHSMKFNLPPRKREGQRAVKQTSWFCWWNSWHSSDTTHTCRVGCKSWGRLVYWLWWLLWHMRIPFQRSHQSQKTDNQVQGMLEKCPQTVYRERWLYLSVIDNPTKCF